MMRLKPYQSLIPKSLVQTYNNLCWCFGQSKWPSTLTFNINIRRWLSLLIFLAYNGNDNIELAWSNLLIFFCSFYIDYQRITMLQKFRAAFTASNERIEPEYVIKTTDEELYQVSQVMLIKERVVILETDQYRECVLEKSHADVNPVYGEHCGC